MAKRIIMKTITAKEAKMSRPIQGLAPDVGWGWIVCIGAFFANFIADGTMYSSGIQLLAFLDYFGESKAKTAWVSSSQLGLSMIMGPAVSFFIDKYSIRKVTIAGGVLAFLGTVGGAFSPNLPILIFSYGVLCGTGLCLFFISSIVAVGLYFSQKRAIATGIAMSGSGIGVIVYPYLTETLLNIFDWRNTMLIIAGLCLNACVCGCLFRPLATAKLTEKANAVICLEENLISENTDIKPQMELVSSDKMMCNSTSGLDTSLPLLNTNKIETRQYNSDINLHCKKRETQIMEANNALKSDVFYIGSIDIIPAHESEVLGLHNTKLLREDIETKSKAPCLSWDTSIFRECFSLLKRPSFIILLICMVMWTAQAVTITYIPDMAVSKGISRYDAATLISIVGITNTVIRVVAGFIVDVFHVQSLHLYIVALCLGAASNMALPWCSSFILLAMCSVGFGLCMGTVVCLRTILIADVLGIESLTTAFGIIAFFQGVAFTVNPPVAGFVFDMTGSYIYPFMLVSGFYIIAGALCVLLLCTHQRQTAHEIIVNAKENDDDVSQGNGHIA